jgi:hypothetical protein
MFFVNLLKSLDDLLYELMSWLVFYPLTLWRAVHHPWGMMDYASRELNDGEHHQYTDTLSPPLFLLVTLLLSHALELALVGESTLVTSRHGLASLINDDTSLLMLRLVVFAVFPMILAVRLVRLERRKLTRETLRRPFYAQCYPAGVFALIEGIGSLCTQLDYAWGDAAGMLVMLSGLVWYAVLQARWFSRALRVSWPRGLGHASIGLLTGVGVIFVAAPLLT